MSVHVIRLESGELPDTLVAACQARGIFGGLVHAGGIVQDAVLRVFDPSLRAFGSPRNVPGNVALVTFDGSFGHDGTQSSMGQRVVLSRESDGNLTTFAGELVSARIVAIEAFVTEVPHLTRSAAADFGVVLANDARAMAQAANIPPAPTSGVLPEEALRAGAPEAPGSQPSLRYSTNGPDYDRIEATPRVPVAVPSAAISPPNRPTAPPPVQMPQRIAKKVVDVEDELFPEEGDWVEHFAFGTCEIVTSDGDRLHIKLEKNGSIKEIAVAVLKVTQLPDRDGHKAFKLERKL